MIFSPGEGGLFGTLPSSFLEGFQCLCRGDNGRVAEAGTSPDRAGDGKCTLGALSRPPAPRDVLLRECPGIATHEVAGFTLRGNQKRARARPPRRTRAGGSV